MIVGIGLDMVEIDRIDGSLARFGERFTRRVLTASENLVAQSLGADRRAAHVAARFAAKEAGVKALGTGFANGIGPQDIEVANLEGGQPVLCLHGAAATRAAVLGVARSHLTLTHTRTTAAAVVILES